MLMKTLQNEKPRHLIGKVVVIKGETFKVTNVGFFIDDKVYLHLSSTERFIQQKNGKRAIQVCDWFPLDAIQ